MDNDLKIIVIDKKTKAIQWTGENFWEVSTFSITGDCHIESNENEQLLIASGDDEMLLDKGDYLVSVGHNITKMSEKEFHRKIIKKEGDRDG